MLEAFGRFRKASVAVFLLSGAACVWAVHDASDATAWLKKLNILAGVPFACCLSDWLLKRGHCKASPFLSSASFFVYVAHPLIVGKVLKLLFVAIRPATGGAVLAVHLLSIALVTGSLLGVFYLLRRCAPRLLVLLAGRK